LGETIRPCGSGADFAFSVAGNLGRILASGVEKVERVFFRPSRLKVKGPNRSIRPQTGLCGLTEFDLSDREKDLSPGMHKPFGSTEGLLVLKSGRIGPKTVLFFDSGCFIKG